ncbi:MAG: DUF3179 domain-containing protein [Saprospiraceae bacterium]|nr:DUF3179 domain-containing protein [Saprospiraceae bacterium]
MKSISFLLSLLAFPVLIFAQYNDFELTDLLIPKSEIHHGGPPKDGIPAIDQPVFVSADEANFLKADDRVLGLSIEGQAKAYPIKILNYHEVVNDEFDDRAVVVTFCPLCGSGLAFDAMVEGITRTFGVSGLLYNSDVLLYDRQTESLWSQLMMKAVSGPASGTELQPIPTSFTTWSDWKSRHPESLVLTPDTGHQRNYDLEPYANYVSSSQLMFPVAHSNSDLPPKELVIGLEIGEKAKAYPFSRLKASAGIVWDTFMGERLRIQYNKEAESAIITDAEGEELPAVTLFWFAWYAFHPETAIYDEQ